MDKVKGVASAGRCRRRHSEEFKSRVVQACQQPGASITSVARANQLSASLLRRWLIQRSAAPSPSVASAWPSHTAAPARKNQFLPVKLERNPNPVADIRVELRRGSSNISVSWPAPEAAACAAWLCEWLR